MDAISTVQAPGLSTSLQQDAFSFDQQGLSPDETSLGDKFFQILSDTKQEIKEKTSQIETSLKVDEITPVDLLRLQFEIAEITIQQELISKGVSKSTQNVDTLLKAQ
ncbi:Yop proteins translocation protein I [Thalassocella blandensis]|nr:Yop proteins translocation protein I [Thalassocella blandensis]